MAVGVTWTMAVFAEQALFYLVVGQYLSRVTLYLLRMILRSSEKPDDNPDD